MFEVGITRSGGDATVAAAPGPADVLAFAEALTGDTGGLDDRARIDMLRALERLKSAAEGTQAVVTAELDTSQRARAAQRGEPAERQGRGIAHQVALARRVSPHRGQRLAGLAKVLVREMPCTLRALRGGHITEWTASLLARETACLSLPDRRRVDARLCADVDRAEGMSVGEISGAARRLAAELDPASVAARRSWAEADRCVTVRPAPDTMTWLTGHLPVKQGVAVFAALKAEADRLAGTGDGRTRGQIMADTLVGRVLGATDASRWPDPTAVQPERGSQSQVGEPGVPVTVNVVISAEALLGEEEAGAEVPGVGPVTAETVRAWVREGLRDGTPVELRRLFASPATGQLVAMESGARLFPKALAEFIGLRDQRCRTPWCDAPVRHADHVTAHHEGGPTSAANGQGLCESCNYAKEAVGWSARPRPGPGHEVETTTPTGHHYRSSAPALAGTTPLKVDLFWAA